MNQVQCSCGKYYDADNAFCPHCGEAKSICSHTEDLSKYAPKAKSYPVGVFVFAILNTIFGSPIAMFARIFCIIFILVELALVISSISYFRRRIRNKGLAIATCVLGVTGIIIGIIIFSMQMLAS